MRIPERIADCMRLLRMSRPVGIGGKWISQSLSVDGQHVTIRIQGRTGEVTRTLRTTPLLLSQAWVAHPIESPET
jgi:hypothetical protein